MRNEDRGTDLLQERNDRRWIDLLLLGEIHDRGHLRIIELVEGGIAGLAFTGPLGVEMRLRPELVTLRRDKPLRQPFHIGRADSAMNLRPMRGTPTSDAIDHID